MTSKDNLEPGQYALIGDFVENYNFVVYDVSQSFL